MMPSAVIDAIKQEVGRLESEVPISVQYGMDGEFVRIGKGDHPYILEIPHIFTQDEFVKFMYEILALVEEAKPRKPNPHWNSGPIPERSGNSRRKWKVGTTEFTIKSDADTLNFIYKPIWK